MPIIQLQLSASWKYIRKMMKVKEKNEKSTGKHIKSQEGFHWIMKLMRELADPGTAGDLARSMSSAYCMLSPVLFLQLVRPVRQPRDPIRPPPDPRLKIRLFMLSYVRIKQERICRHGYPGRRDCRHYRTGRKSR